MDYTILLPSQPKIVLEEESRGMYEIDGLYPGYGHTLGNSLRRIILSSLPGAAITSVKISGADHEFTTLSGIREDVITILLNLKKVRVKMLTNEPQTLVLKAKGDGEVKASAIEVPGQVEVLTPDQVIAHITDPKGSLELEMTVERGLGYVAKEVLQKERVDIGSITLDAVFSPIRRVNYEVELMRVGDRTDFNRLRLFIETDGTITPKEVLEKSIGIMIHQLKAIVGFQEDEPEEEVVEEESEDEEHNEIDQEFLKTRIESLNLSARTENALSKASIRTVGGLVRKSESDLLEFPGLGNKGIEEINSILAEHDITLKED